MAWAGPACRPRRHARCARSAALASVAKRAVKHGASVMGHVADPARMIAAVPGPEALARCEVTMIVAVPGPMAPARCAAAAARPSAAKVATGARWSGAT
jgi:hypothetical protein